MKFKVFSHDVWGNAKDGFEVNDTFEEGIIEISDLSDMSILRALKSEGLIKKHCQLRWLDIDGDDMSIYINQKKDDFPLFSLYLEEE